MTSDLAVSTTDVIECLRFVRMHLYAAQAQASDCDDKIIMQHVRDAYARTSDICREIEMYGMTLLDDKELTFLRAKLKNGEHDGADIMYAWLAIDELRELRAWRDKAFQAHPNLDRDVEALGDGA